MNLREITIGRSKNSDIYLDERCKYASSMHGTIFYDGSQLMFRDTSTNGTMINNVSVRKRAVPIKHGDIIMLAGKYQLNWNQIDEFFPYNSYAQRNTGTIIDTAASSQVISRGEPNIRKWNWGAFGLYSIWGFFNGCPWAILIGLFFGWSLIPNIIFGIYGSEWAWKNKNWQNVEEFNKTQSDWAIWGIIASCFALFGFLMILLMPLAFVL